jgi:subtilisin family serine protease
VQDAVVYGTAIEGYAGRVPPGKLDAIRSDPRVAYVEPDGIVQATTTQSNATWGLDRTDQRALPLSTTFTYFNTGSGVTAYIIDTGIRFSHAQFGGRASSGYDAVDGGSADDCDGHGTHVAGTVGGSTYGVAKGVSLKAVRVLNCSGSGTWSGVIAGINWATQDHIAVGTPAVANMSLGGGASSSVDTAVRNSINAGVSYAIAAGNGNQGGKEQDACKYSPARVTEAMTIGATDRTDTKPRWSNYGTCVDWFAPGVSITSAWVTSDTASSTISGTSMATPHTAGVAALYLQSNASASPTAVRTALFNNTTKNIVKSSKTTNAHLLFTNY